MKRKQGFYYLSILLVVMALMVSCDRSEGDILDTLDQQKDLLVKSSYEIIPGQYVVTYHSNNQKSLGTVKNLQDYKSIEERRKNEIVQEFNSLNIEKKSIKSVYGFAINGFAAKLSDDQLLTLSRDSRVKSIEQDYLVIMAPPSGKGPGGGGGSSAEEIPYGITRVSGGQTYTGSNVAYILDTGIDLDHEDLNVDASRGFNAFTSGKDAKSLDDGNGHGTHVAGTVAAIDNEVGVVGVAAGATVVPVKVLDRRGSGSYSGVIAGVDFVGANAQNGDVANMSLGGPISQSLDDAVVAASANVRFALAAGNESQDANSSSPARANGNNIYTVSAMDSNDNFASFSNYGNPPVDYCAPGVAIKSTWKDGGYNTISGTSMASPHVCGILLWGNISPSGSVNGDPDGNADPIASR